MKFLIVTFAPTLKHKDHFASYGPYVKEMNLWAKFANEVIICSPINYNKELLLDNYNFSFKQIALKSFSIISLPNIFKSVLIIPFNIIQLFRAMFLADHIHLRCPGNIGLLGCCVQVFFPFKPKTVKYAGNWDPKSKQPFTYRLQKWIVSNTFLTRNCKVLVYGEWKNQTKNIIPFFTASYSKNEIEDIPLKELNGIINFIFVGTFSEGKRPLLSVKAVEELAKKGYNVRLDMYGSGKEYKTITNYIEKQQLQNIVIVHGNQPKGIIKKAFQKAHFLIFISKSEGWPKVVAEAMFWSCLPISSKVSCVPFMLNNGKRGGLVNNNLGEVVDKIEEYIINKTTYITQVKNAKSWSQQYTLESFERAIKKIMSETE